MVEPRPFADLYRRLPRWVSDWGVAGLLAVVGLIELVLAVDDRESLLRGLVALVFVTLALGVRRRLPILAVVVGFATLGISQQDPELYDTTTPFLGLLLLPYSLARHTDGRRWHVGLAVLALTILVTFSFDPEAEGVAPVTFAALVLIGGPVTAGRLLRNRAQLTRALRDKRATLERERAAAAEQAALDERTRIASELHDVVSHALSAMTVQASAARRLAERDPGRAGDAFLAVESTGREALTELRRMLGVLRRDDEEIALAPQPSLAHVSSLVQRAQRLGLPIQLRVEGEPPAHVPAGVDLTGYRVLQAALNAARDAGSGAAWVSVRYEPASVELGVTDDGAPTRAYLGVRERVAFYGGELTTLPRPEGGHTLRARLPLEGAAA